MQQAIDIIIAILATYGIVTLVSQYDGPNDLFKKLRKDKKVFECSVCLTPWIALVPAIFMPLGFFEYLSVVGATVLLDRNL